MRSSFHEGIWELIMPRTAVKKTFSALKKAVIRPTPHKAYWTCIVKSNIQTPIRSFVHTKDARKSFRPTSTWRNIWNLTSETNKIKRSRICLRRTWTLQISSQVTVDLWPYVWWTSWTNLWNNISSNLTFLPIKVSYWLISNLYLFKPWYFAFFFFI